MKYTALAIHPDSKAYVAFVNKEGQIHLRPKLPEEKEEPVQNDAYIKWKDNCKYVPFNTYNDANRVLQRLYLKYNKVDVDSWLEEDKNLSIDCIDVKWQCCKGGDNCSEQCASEGKLKAFYKSIEKKDDWLDIHTKFHLLFGHSDSTTFLRFLRQNYKIPELK